MLEQNRKRINVLTGIKVICLFVIFWWHSQGVAKPGIDLGARAVEIFIIISGFLSAYNYRKQHTSLFKEITSIYIKKLKQFYPLHLVCFLICVTVLNDRYNILTSILNLSLLQAWSNDINVYFSYNGLSWYLSVIIFCYSVVPFCVRIYKRINKNNILINDLIIFLLVFIIRLLVDIFNNIYGLNISTHTFVPVRVLEFLVGMLACQIYQKTNNKVEIKTLVVFEFVAPILALILCRTFNNIWPRSVFVLLFCIVILIYAYEKGPLSKILSSRVFVFFNKIQLEFYMLHHLVIRITDNVFHLDFNGYLLMLFNFVITIIISIITKWLIKLFNKVVSNLYHKITIN